MRKLITILLVLQVMTAGNALATDCERFVTAQVAMEDKALSLICIGKTDEEAQVEIDAYMKANYPEWKFGAYPFGLTRFLTTTKPIVCAKGLTPLRKVKILDMCVQQHWDLTSYRNKPTRPADK
jgi:hypothetical protein